MSASSQPPRFRRFRINNWSGIDGISARMKMWGFRGHSNTEGYWNLNTSLHRAAAAVGYKLEGLKNREEWMLYQFRRRAHHYLSRFPPENARLEWLALMQHYGAPTRLLDFTHSVYIASHFAFQRPGKDVSIWAINVSCLWVNLERRLGLIKGEDDFPAHTWRIDQFRREAIKDAEKYVAEGAELGANGLACIEPETLTERESIQQGFFVMPLKIGATFGENLETELGISAKQIDTAPEEEWKDDSYTHDCRLVEFRIHRSKMVEICDRLSEMNITEATLFPGLDGYARSLARTISLVIQPAEEAERAEQ